MVLLMNRSVDQKAKSWCYFLLLWNAACNEDYILLQFHHTTGSSLISSRNMNQRQHASLLYSMHEFQFLFQFWLGRWTVGQKGKPESWCCLLLYICSDIPVLVVTVNTESWCYLLLLWELGGMDLATRISLITPRSFEQIDKYSNIQMIKIQKHEYDQWSCNEDFIYHTEVFWSDQAERAASEVDVARGLNFVSATCS